MRVRKEVTAERKKYTFGTLITQLSVLIAAVFFASPLFIVLSYSFKTKKEIYTGNPLSLPEAFNFDNYETAFKKLNLSTTLLNTLIYTVVSVAILALICGAAAWAIARNRKKFYKFAYIFFIIGLLIPAQALFLPIYTVGFNTGLVNSRLGVIFMYIATNISFGIFLMNSFMMTVPIELEEAAKIDGCSVIGTYFRIVLPLLKPAIATLVIMQSFQIWNDYLMSSLFVSTNELKTITVAIQALFSQQTSDYTTAFAAIVISVLPICILFIVLQKYFIKGMTMGAVKG